MSPSHSAVATRLRAASPVSLQAASRVPLSPRRCLLTEVTLRPVQIYRKPCGLKVEKLLALVLLLSTERYSLEWVIPESSSACWQKAGHDPVHQQLSAVTSRGKLTWEETDTRRIVVWSAVRFAGGHSRKWAPTGGGAGECVGR